MKRSFLLTTAVLVIFGCAEIRDLTKREDPYENPFYAKYLNTGSALDARITRTIEALREDPNSAPLHNELGSLLVQKGFPKDAEREFERSVNLNGNYYPAWYNLGLVRASRGDDIGARRAFSNTIEHKPGHAQALFELGLIEEKRRNNEAAVELYAKAYRINPALLGVRTNPRVLDSRLTHLALLKMYPDEHERRSMNFQGTPSGWQDRREDPEAPSPEQTPEKIVPPAPPATDPSQQPQKPPTR